MDQKCSSYSRWPDPIDMVLTFLSAFGLNLHSVLPLLCLPQFYRSRPLEVSVPHPLQCPASLLSGQDGRVLYKQSLTSPVEEKVQTFSHRGLLFPAQLSDLHD